jgi:hypothetical protein
VQGHRLCWRRRSADRTLGTFYTPSAREAHGAKEMSR